MNTGTPGTAELTNSDHLLTPHDVAKVLGITTKTLRIWRYTKRYYLPYMKVGQLIRYRPEDVTGFIEAHMHEQPYALLGDDTQ